MSCPICAGYAVTSCPVCGPQERVVTCPDCNGTGMMPYKAFNIHTRNEVEVTRETWVCLPYDEDQAAREGKRYCRADRDICPACQGLGEIEQADC